MHIARHTFTDYSIIQNSLIQKNDIRKAGKHKDVAFSYHKVQRLFEGYFVLVKKQQPPPSPPKLQERVPWVLFTTSQTQWAIPISHRKEWRRFKSHSLSCLLPKAAVPSFFSPNPAAANMDEGRKGKTCCNHCCLPPTMTASFSSLRKDSQCRQHSSFTAWWLLFPSLKLLQWRKRMHRVEFSDLKTSDVNPASSWPIGFIVFQHLKHCCPVSCKWAATLPGPSFPQLCLLWLLV